MTMIGPLPVSPAAPTPWSFDAWSHTVRDAHGHYLFEINGEELGPGENAALARELVDLVNRAAASSATYADAYEVGYRNAMADAALADTDPVTHLAQGTAQAAPEPPAVELPAAVETGAGLTVFYVEKLDDGITSVTVRGGRTGLTIRETYLDPSAARTLAHALLAAAGPEPVSGPAEPDPRDPSTWVRYVDEDGDEWFEFAPGRVWCGSREGVGNWVQSLIDAGGDPTDYSAYLDDARESCGLRRA